MLDVVSPMAVFHTGQRVVLGAGGGSPVWGRGRTGRYSLKRCVKGSNMLLQT